MKIFQKNYQVKLTNPPPPPLYEGLDGGGLVFTIH